MKTSVLKNTHTGKQPIRVLKHNLTHRLVNRNEQLILSLQANSKLSGNIKYHIADLPLSGKQLPFIDNKGIINLHETYLSYIWIISFTMFVIYEEGLAIPDQIKRNIPTHKSQNQSLIELAMELFQYGKSLVTTFYEWDIVNLPNPEYFDENTEEGFYILRTNDLYVETVNFILFHEVAHAELEHIKRLMRNSPWIPSASWLTRLFHLSFDLGVQYPYPYLCDMGANSIAGNQ